MKILMLSLLIFSISYSDNFDTRDEYSIQSTDYPSEVLLEEETPEGIARILLMEQKEIELRQDNLLNSSKAVHVKKESEIRNTLRAGYKINSMLNDTTIAEVEDNFNKADKVVVMPKDGNQFNFYFLEKVDTKRMKLGAILVDAKYSKGCQVGLIFDSSILKNHNVKEGDIITSANYNTIAKCNTLKYLMSKDNKLILQYNRSGNLLETVVQINK